MRSTISCVFCGADLQPAVTLPQHQILACRRCRIARTEPPPQEVPYEVQDFHGEQESLCVEDLPSTWRRGLEQQANLLCRHLPKRSRVLEVGCGHGLLLGVLANRGLQVQGIDPSHAATKAANRRGLPVQQGYFPNPSMPAGPFDAVVLSHVLEHLPDPHHTLEHLIATAPGGLLLLVQANWRGWVPRKTGQLWHAWAEGHHYWHFTPGGLRSWLQSRGAQPVELEYSSLEHGNYWLARLARYFPGASDQFHLLVRLPEH